MPSTKKDSLAFLDKSKRFQKYGTWIIALIIVTAISLSSILSTTLKRDRDRTAARQRERGTWCDADGHRVGRVAHRCTTLDLTMRAVPLGDKGAAQIVAALRGKRYAKRERRRLRRLL